MTNRSRSAVFGFLLGLLLIGAAEAEQRDNDSPPRIPLSRSEEAWIKAHPIIRLGANKHWAPLDFSDKVGIQRGICMEYVGIAAERAGIELEIESLASRKLLFDEAKAQRVDGVLCLARSNRDYLRYTRAFFAASLAVVTREGQASESFLESVAKKTIAVEYGTERFDTIQTDYPQADLLVVNSALEALDAVSKNKADTYLGNVNTIKWLIDEYLIDNLKVHAPLAEKTELRVGVRQDWAKLAEILQKGLDAITPLERRRINRKWLSRDNPTQEITLTKRETDWIKQHPFVTYSHIDWEPITIVDNKGQVSGLINDYLYLIGQRTGLRFRFSNIDSWPLILKRIKDKTIDFSHATGKTKAREKYALFTKPYLSFPMAVITRSDVTYIGDIKELIGKKIAVGDGYAGHEYLLEKYPEMDIVTTADVVEGLKRVNNGQVFAFVGNMAVTTYNLQKLGLTNLKVSGTSEHDFLLRTMVRQDYPELVSIFNKGIDSISDQERRVIYQKWIPITEERQIDNSLIVKIVTGMAFALLLIGLWNLQMRRQKKALQISEERFMMAMEAASEGLWDSNLTSGETYYSPRFMGILGYQPDEFPNRATTWINLLHPEDRAKILGKIEDHLRIGADKTLTLLYRMRTKSGEYQNLFLKGKVVERNGEGKALRAVGIHVDITDYIKTQQELTRQKMALDASSILEITDAQGSITYVNKKFCRISGYSSAEVIGQNHRIMKSDRHSKSLWAQMYATASKGNPWRAEICNLAKDGSRYWVDSTIIGMTDSSGEVEKYIAIRQDITDRKQVEEELNRAKQEAEKANRYKSEFLANMSHEIRTPMNAIIGMGHLALKTDLTEKQRDLLDKVQTSSQTLLNIINDILDFSKIEAGQLDIETIDFYLDNVLENVADLFRLKADQKGLELLFDFKKEIPFALTGDPLRLGQILINLVSNAVKFTDRGEVIVGADLIDRSVNQATLRFFVKDTGIGIQEQEIAKLFDSFYQVDSTTTRVYGGTGLGLTICKRLVELMNGVIDVESEPGVGSTFVFNVTFALQDKVDDRHWKPPSDLRGLRVLIVDDNEAAQRIMASMLASFSFKVTTAGSADEACDLLESTSDAPFDLVILDWLMPHIDGIEAAKRIKRQRPPHAPTIIMVTAHARQDVISRANQLGLGGFLTKPVNPSMLFDTIVKAIHGAGNESLAKPDPPIPDKLKGKVLIVEDNPINQEFAGELLKSFGLDVAYAGNGIEAITAVENSQYDLVLMDIQMPELDGLEATRRIRQNQRFHSLPIIAMTAHAMIGDKDKSLAAGMNGHITKPMVPDELYSELCEWLEVDEEPRSEQLPSEGIITLPDYSNSFDVETGLKQIGGNRRLFNKVLIEFRRDHHNDLAKLEKALQERDFDKALFVIHTLKGISGNIGATQLHSCVESIETSLKERNLEEAKNKIGQFSASFAELMETLGKLNRQPEDKPTVPAQKRDAATQVKALEELEMLLADGDAGAVDKIRNDKSLLLIEGAEDQVALLEQQINDYEFGAAQLTLASISAVIQTQIKERID